MMSKSTVDIVTLAILSYANYFLFPDYLFFYTNNSYIKKPKARLLYHIIHTCTCVLIQTDRCIYEHEYVYVYMLPSNVCVGIAVRLPLSDLPLVTNRPSIKSFYPSILLNYESV